MGESGRARWFARHATLVREIEQCAFIRGVMDGSLDANAFRRFLTQDAFFLEGFAKAYCGLASRSRCWEQVVQFHRLAQGVIDERSQLHEASQAQWQLTLDDIQPQPATTTYLDGIRQFAADEPAPCVSLAALVPCMSVYAHLGKYIASHPEFATEQNAYKRWVDTYSDADFQALTAQLEDMLDEMDLEYADNKHVAAFVKLCYAFAMQMELEFFNAATRVP